MEKVSRRNFFKAAGATAATGVAARAFGAPPADGPASHAAKENGPHHGTYLFFNRQEARLIEALTERLIPADENGPGAADAAVPRFIDRQLAGAWGAGERLYRSGPWHAGEPTQGYQLPFTPAELFRAGLRAMRDDLAQRWPERAIDALTPDEQDNYLGLLEKGDITLGPIPGKVFFESLLSMTIEGFFSDPVYGGNRDMVAWKMIGFPGAYATFYELVDQHGMRYTGSPMSLGDTGRGAIRLHPATAPATSNGGG